MSGQTERSDVLKKPPGLVATLATIVFAGALIYTKPEHVTPVAVAECTKAHDSADRGFRKKSGFFLTEKERQEYIDIGNTYRACVNAAEKKPQEKKSAAAPTTAAKRDQNGVVYDIQR